MAALGTAALLAATAAPADARARTTAEQTIADRDGDDRLEPAPRDAHLVRTELGTPSPDRERTRVPLLTFGQLTDMHLVDEESPLRVELLDRLGPPFTSAYRPQEGLSAQVMETMVRQMRTAVSPVTHRRAELVMTTGDNSDNTQLNETRWFIDLLDGGTVVDPDSGVPVPGCEATPGSIYDGVRGRDEYYEPDSSGVPGADSEDGPGYSPDREENEREAQRRSTVRDWPGLFEAMNRPFRATGLGMPWYGIFGNHDALLQGNQGRNPQFEAIALGCTKVLSAAPGGLAAVEGAVTARERATGRVTEPATVQAVRGLLLDPAAAGGAVAVVPPDARRRPLRKTEYMAEHFVTTGEPAGHGFGLAPEIANGQGYYAFQPRPGVRFVVLDSIAEGGGDGGNIDHIQYGWLEKQLKAADIAGELAVVFAHHTLDTMVQPPVSVFPPGDQGGELMPLVHFGTEPRPPGAPELPCPPVSEPSPTETLRCQFLRHPSVVAFVAGHEHANEVLPHERVPGGGPASGGFWEIATAAHIDWPQQSRLLDLIDNADGTVSIVGTLIDHGAPPEPGGPPPPRAGQGAATDAVMRLAAISRELSFNDPDSSNGQDGRGDARGGEGDRNVELVVRRP